MQFRIQRYSYKKSGFTLIEVLLSTVIGVSLILLLANAAIDTATNNKRLTEELDRSARARLVLDLLVNDLQSIVLRRDTNNWIAIDVLSDTKNSNHWQTAVGQKPDEASLALQPKIDSETGMINPEDYRFGIAGTWLRFITTAEDRSIFTSGKLVPGDINAVAYQIIRRALPSVPSASDLTNAGYQIHRSIVRADFTFDTGYSVETYKGTSDLGRPGEIKSPRLDSVVCDQVIDFGIIVHQINKDGKLVQGFPSRDPSLTPLKNPLKYRAPQDGIPVRLEILVRIISGNGARELRAREQGSISPDDWWQLAYRESRVYSRTLSLPQAF